jgi:hypothetical protein
VHTEPLELMLLRLNRVHHAALLLVPHGKRLGQVKHKPALRRDVAAIRGLGQTRFFSRHSSSSELGRAS